MTEIDRDARDNNKNDELLSSTESSYKTKRKDSFTSRPI